MPSSRAVFDLLNSRKFGVNRHLRFFPFSKNSNVPYVGAYFNPEVCRVWVPWFNEYYAATHGTFPSFLEIDKTTGAYSLQIYAYLSPIQSETKAFLLIVRHSTEGPPISDWQ